VCAGLELVPGEAQHLEGVEVHEVKAAATIYEGLRESGCPNLRVNNEGEVSWLTDAIQVVRPVKSDQGLRPAQVLWDCHANGVDRSAGEFELAV
jgi:hypothetical protein